MKLTSIVVVAAGVLAVAGCSSKPATASHASPAAAQSTAAAAPSPTGEPRTYEAAKAAVARLTAIEKAHDGGAAWDMLTSSGQAAMSRADYIKVTSQCSKMFTSEPALSVALNDAGTVATVKSSDGSGGTFEWQLVYENGHWRHQPSDGAMQWMVLSVDKALALLHNGGVC